LPNAATAPSAPNSEPRKPRAPLPGSIAFGRLRVGKNKYRLRKARGGLGPGKARVLRLRPLNAKQRLRIAAALLRGQTAKATVTMRIADRAGNTRKRTVSVRLFQRRSKR
jgi:hypothetical protein